MAELAGLVQRLEVAVGRLETVAAGGGGSSAGGSGAVSVYVDAYDSLISGPVAQYLATVGTSVSHLLCTDFAANLSSLLAPVSKAIQEVQSFRELHRSSPLFNHLSAVSESVPALGWVAMEPKPGPYVKEMQDAATFYTNRVLKDYKDKDQTHVDWVKAYIAIWTDLQAYIKQHHTTGLSWSKSGPVASASAAPRAPGGAPPPPPPGPPPPPMDLSGPAGGDSAEANRNALFASLNKGSDITKGLKHVSDDQKTHKNPALKGPGGPLRSGPKPFSSPKAAAASPARSLPAVLELDGKKWKVENQEGAQGLVISDTELKQVVYAFKCSNSTLQVKGKINSITVDNCKKMGLVFDDVVGIVEVINCKDVKVQVMGKVPTISINKTDGCHVYLSPDSLQCEIVSAKSSEMNVLVPGKDGDYTELPVPEQFKTVWDGKKLVTTATEIAG
uniref:Adenylyl cyclase-associated protein n=1 Tax=Denticeps clupeoides TaxID=299321 RepID=A0AAY4CJ23_9TELE